MAAKSAKRSQKKRGAPYGNKNASGKHRRRRGGRPQNQPQTPLIQPGSDDDPVMQGFALKRQQLSEQYEQMLTGINNAEQAYVQSTEALGTLGRGHTPTLRDLRMTQRGTPDLRTKAGREWMDTHPNSFLPAERAD